MKYGYKKPALLMVALYAVIWYVWAYQVSYRLQNGLMELMSEFLSGAAYQNAMSVLGCVLVVLPLATYRLLVFDSKEKLSKSLLPLCLLQAGMTWMQQMGPQWYTELRIGKYMMELVNRGLLWVLVGLAAFVGLNVLQWSVLIRLFRKARQKEEFVPWVRLIGVGMLLAALTFLASIYFQQVISANLSVLRRSLRPLYDLYAKFNGLLLALPGAIGLMLLQWRGVYNGAKTTAPQPTSQLNGAPEAGPWTGPHGQRPAPQPAPQPKAAPQPKPAPAAPAKSGGDDLYAEFLAFMGQSGTGGKIPSSAMDMSDDKIVPKPETPAHTPEPETDTNADSDSTSSRDEWI